MTTVKDIINQVNTLNDFVKKSYEDIEKSKDTIVNNEDRIFLTMVVQNFFNLLERTYLKEDVQKSVLKNFVEQKKQLYNDNEAKIINYIKKK